MQVSEVNILLTKKILPSLLLMNSQKREKRNGASRIIWRSYYKYST